MCDNTTTVYVLIKIHRYLSAILPFLSCNAFRVVVIIILLIHTSTHRNTQKYGKKEKHDVNAYL